MRLVWCEAREHERLDVTNEILVVLLWVLLGYAALAGHRLRRLMQPGEKRGELVRDPPPFVCEEPAERGGVELPAGEDRVAGERAVGGLVDVVGDADRGRSVATYSWPSASGSPSASSCFCALRRIGTSGCC